MNSKSDNQKYHAKKRAKQRFDIDLNRHLRKYFIRCIQHQVRSDIIRYNSRSLRVHTYLITYKDKLIKLVYDSIRCNIVTFLIPSDEEIEFFNLKRRKRKCI